VGEPDIPGGGGRGNPRSALPFQGVIPQGGDLLLEGVQPVRQRHDVPVPLLHRRGAAGPPVPPGLGGFGTGEWGLGG